MKDRTDVLPVSELVGRSVLSLSSGNKLGVANDVYIDALNGVLVGLSLTTPDGSCAALSFNDVHSFGSAAIMAETDEAAKVTAENIFAAHPDHRQLTGTKLVTESGEIIGHIAGIFVSLDREPLVFYDVRESLLDTLLGRRRFIFASAANALSDDRQRLIVPDQIAASTAGTIDELINGGLNVRSFSPGRLGQGKPDDTVVIVPAEAEDETVVRTRDEDETIVHHADDDETVVRFRRRR